MGEFSVRFLSQAIVGLPGATVSQASTDTSAVLSGGLDAGFYLVQSDGVAHLQSGADGSTPTAVPATSFRLPANQLVGISVTDDIEVAIIRGADESANGTVWFTRMLETAEKL